MAKWKPKRPLYCLPVEDCERVRATEMSALRWANASFSTLALAQEDLKDRLECIPDGKGRYARMIAMLFYILGDLFGTIPPKQVTQIKHAMQDFELRMVPKLTKNDHRVVIGVEDIAYLVKYAKRELCYGCINGDPECRSCKLYQIMEAIAPRQDYGSGVVCPYMTDDWMNESEEIENGEEKRV